MSDIDEALVEAAALEWFEGLGYAVAHGLTPDEEDPAAERRSYRDVVLVERLWAAIARINPGIPAEAREEALWQALLVEGPGIIGQNRRSHMLLADGVAVEYQRPDGTTAHDIVWLLDFGHPVVFFKTHARDYPYWDDRSLG